MITVKVLGRYLFLSVKTLVIMSKTILCINRNRAMNYLLHTVLADRYNYLSVEDIYSAVNELKHNSDIKAIIFDLDYYGREAWDFIQHIGTSRLYQKPLIVLTSDHSKIMNDKIAEAKVYDFFHKPFSPHDIARAIDEIMISESIENQVALT